MNKTILSISLLFSGISFAEGLPFDWLEPLTDGEVSRDIKPIEVNEVPVIVKGQNQNGTTINADGTGIYFWEESSVKSSQNPDGSFTAKETYFSSEKGTLQIKKYSSADAEKIYDRLG